MHALSNSDVRKSVDREIKIFCKCTEYLNFIRLNFCACFEYLFHLQEGRDDFIIFLFFVGKRFIAFSRQYVSFHPSLLSSRNLLRNITEECPLLYSRFFNNPFVARHIPLVVYTQIWRIEIYTLRLTLKGGLTSI